MLERDVRAELVTWPEFRLYAGSFRLFLLGFACLVLVRLLSGYLSIGVVKAVVLTGFPLMFVDFAVLFVSGVLLKRKLGSRVEDPFGVGFWMMKGVFRGIPRT